MNRARAYRDRREAGQVLAEHVRERVGQRDAIVLGLPRGGVPVAQEVAHALDAPLDIFVVRKLGVPAQPELAMGAIAPGGFEILNHTLVSELGISRLQIAVVADRELGELQRREEAYRAHRPPADLRGRTVILVDDGLATGFTMRAASLAVQQRNPARLIVAVPVGAASTCNELADQVEEVICPLQPEPFYAVGMWYEDFSPTSDDEVRACVAAEIGHAR